MNKHTGLPFIVLAAALASASVLQSMLYGTVSRDPLVLSMVCAGVALVQIKRRDKPIVPLASRMRVAIATPRIPRGTVKQAVKEVATTIPLVSLAPGERGRGGNAVSARTNRPVQLGLMLAAVGLLGFTAARRRRHGHRLDA